MLRHPEARREMVFEEPGSTAVAAGGDAGGG
jgi:hypothetical protein